MSLIELFGVLELVGLLVAVVGLAPVLTQHKEVTKWFTAGYGLLVVGMVATNAEDVIFPVVLNFTEHVIGIGVAGVVFLYAAYHRRQHIAQGGV